MFVVLLMSVNDIKLATQILIGTASSEILEIVIASGSVRKLLTGHYSGELWGLAAHPILQRIATAGDDGIVRYSQHYCGSTSTCTVKECLAYIHSYSNKTQ
jgi:hypothetical protein